MTNLAAQLRAGRARRARSLYTRCILLALAVAAFWALSLMVGESFYGPGTVARVIASQFSGQTVPGASFVVGELRLPRATVGLAVGFALGIAGAVFQTLLRNQLASPDIIGISAGAAAAGVTALALWHLSQTQASLVALVGALVVAGAIYWLSFNSGFSGTRLILIGIGVAALLGSWVNYVLSRAAAWDLNTATRWLTGSLNTMDWQRGLPVIVATAVGVPLLLIAQQRLGVLRLGDELALGLGVRVTAARVVLIVIAVALIAVATAAAGPVSFVAFMSGPLASRLLRPGAPLLLASGLVGALVVLAADLAGQTLFGTRYPVGVITGAIGAPFLIYLLTRINR